MLKLTTVDAIERSHTKASRLFGGGVTGDLLQGRYDTDPIHAWFQRRHRHFTHKLVDSDHVCRIHDEEGAHEWHVPYGVRYALDQPLLWAQIAGKYPWYVTWQSPKTHKRLKRKFESLASAIVFVTTRAQYVDPEASIISRHGYDVPPPLRGKFPHKRLGYWCPCCMDARKFYAALPPQTFNVPKKTPTGKWTVRELRLLRCKVCGCTNRDAKFRRSNQPWTVRRFKRGVTRARRRRR